MQKPSPNNDLSNLLQSGNETIEEHNQHVDDLIQRYSRREASSANVVMKVVNNTGTRYRNVLPDWERYQTNPSSNNNMFANGNDVPTQGAFVPYKLGPPVNMNKRQREMQRQGKLIGCIANCQVQPVGQGRKVFFAGSSSSRNTSNTSPGAREEREEYPDPNLILYGQYHSQ
jgi:hypothetical protein